MKLINQLCLTFCLLLLGHNSFSQSGQLYGKIIDTKTNEELVGAKLNISEYITVYSDLDGNFFIKDIPAGKYTIAINSLSYDEQILKEIEIKEDEILRLDIEVIPNALAISEQIAPINR